MTDVRMRWIAIAAASTTACATPTVDRGQSPTHAATTALEASATTTEPGVPAAETSDGAGKDDSDAPAFPVTCARDDDCGFDPSSARCGSDPRYNRQPPVVDQGIVCYCENNTCSLLRVPPVACEGDKDCAVQPTPRPHPVRASNALPHESGRPCHDFTLSTSCERTNICTMHRLQCKSR